MFLMVLVIGLPYSYVICATFYLTALFLQWTDVKTTTDACSYTRCTFWFSSTFGFPAHLVSRVTGFYTDV